MYIALLHSISSVLVASKYGLRILIMRNIFIIDIDVIQPTIVKLFSIFDA